MEILFTNTMLALFLFIKTVAMLSRPVCDVTLQCNINNFVILKKKTKLKNSSFLESIYNDSVYND